MKNLSNTTFDMSYPILLETPLARLKKPLKYPSPPDLPKERLDNSKSFNYVGIDYVGPVFVKEIFNSDLPSNKCWIAIIICASSRALCLDVSKDYSGDSCIEVLRRFFR